MKIRSVDDGQVFHILEGHSPWPMAIAYSPDGNNIASGSMDGILKISSAETGKLIHNIQADSSIFAVGFSPDAKTIASAGYDGAVRIWSAYTGKLVRTINEPPKTRPFFDHPFSIYSIAFSQDGRTIGAGGSDSTVKIWSVDTGRIIHNLKGHTRAVSSIAFSQDDQTIISGSHDGL